MQRIRKGDEVIVIAGRDKGKRGTVLRRVDAQHLVIEGINRVKKHQRPNPMKGEQGGIVDKDLPIHSSNVALYNPQTKDARWYFTSEFAAARTGGSDITLGRGNILENSEAVVVNGERWTRDRDYTIDYDLGRISLKRQLGASDQLSID